MNMTRLIGIMGAKDRVGASRFALELARTIRKENPKVLLVDADCDHPGDLRFLLDWEPPKQLSRPMKVEGDVSVMSLLKGETDSFFEAARFFDWVVADMGSRWNPFVTVLLKETSFLVLVLKPEPSLIEEVKRKLEVLSTFLFPLKKVGWVGPRLPMELPIAFAGEGAEGSWSFLKGAALSEEGPHSFATPLSRDAFLQAVQKRIDEKNAKPHEVDGIIRGMLQENPDLLSSLSQPENFIQSLLDDLIGLGPLEPLLKDRSYTEVLVNGQREIYVEERGRLLKIEARFKEEAALQRVIDRILLPAGRRVDESSPMVDVRLSDGSRVNIILPPVSLDGPAISIRRFSPNVLSPEDLIRSGSADAATLDLLRDAVLKKKNILVSGGTGSGKTTLLNILSSFISPEERIITIEDAAELRLNQPHVVRLESRPPNIEGKGAITIRDLVRNALRMRPDRIVVGECRGGEALDMLQAMNTGHEGSLTTVHANSPKDAMARLETLVLFSGVELPSKVIREQIASAIHLIVQVARLPNGVRKIISVTHNEAPDKN